MEEEIQNVEVVATTETEKVETQTTEETEVKTFTQDEVNDIIKTRLKNIPSKEEIEEYRTWKESQRTPDEIQEELNNKITSLKDDYSLLEQQNLILRSGITDTDDIDYIQYKVSKLEGDFGDNLKSYLSDNPRFTKKEEPKTTGYSQNIANPVISEEKAYLDKKYANNPYYKK